MPSEVGLVGESATSMTGIPRRSKVLARLTLTWIK
jgi:hypothetical protein